MSDKRFENTQRVIFQFHAESKLGHQIYGSMEWTVTEDEYVMLEEQKYIGLRFRYNEKLTDLYEDVLGEAVLLEEEKWRHKKEYSGIKDFEDEVTVEVFY